MELLNNLDIELKMVVVIALIIIGAAVLTRIVRWFINKSFVTASEKLKIDPTRYKFFMNAASFIIWLVALGSIISLIPSLKALAVTLFAGAGGWDSTRHRECRYR